MTEPITDCHHHLWDLKANYYPWLTDRIGKRVCGDYGAIRRDYLIEDFRRDWGGLNVVRSVHVQAEHDRADPVRESRWLQGVADSDGSGGFPHAIVAYADFSRPDVAHLLEAHCQSPNVRGIRQLLHEWLLDPAAHKALLEDPQWRANFRTIADFPLSFDLQVYYPQAEQAYDLVKQNASVQFVLCHMGQPALRDAEGLAGWRAALRLLAELPNVAVKITGAGMFDREWTVESLRPFVLTVIETFGPDRCLFGSNFPVDSMASSYVRLWKAYSEICAEFNAGERQSLFSDNARRIYRI